MKTCIAFFSKQGNTKAVAGLLAKKTKAETIEVTEKIGYKGFIGFMRGGFRAVTEKQAELAPDVYDQIGKYQTIVLATPVWAGKTTPVFNALLANLDLKGKTVYAVMVQADPNGDGHDERIARIEPVVAGSGGTFGGGYSVCAAGPFQGVAPIEKLEDQVRKIAIK